MKKYVADGLKYTLEWSLFAWPQNSIPPNLGKLTNGFQSFYKSFHVWRIKYFEENGVKLPVRSSLSLKDFLSRVLLYQYSYSFPEIPIEIKR